MKLPPSDIAAIVATVCEAMTDAERHRLSKLLDGPVDGIYASVKNLVLYHAKVRATVAAPLKGTRTPDFLKDLFGMQ